MRSLVKALSKFLSHIDVDEPISIKQTAKNQTGINSLLLVRRKTVIVSMRSDRIVKVINVSEKTVI